MTYLVRANSATTKEYQAMEKKFKTCFFTGLKTETENEALLIAQTLKECFPQIEAIIEPLN